MKTLADPALQRELAARITALTPADQRRWGSMSVHQMICHVTEAFECPLGRKSAAPLRPPAQALLLKFAALRIPTRWPQGFPAPPEIAQDRDGKPPAAFASDRAALLAVFHEFCARPPAARAPHPYFGKMSEWEWNRWGYLHTDHHLRQFGR